MSDVFGFLSEFWLRFAEKINIVIFSFVFFWNTLPFIYHFERSIYIYLRHLKHASGNHGYFALQAVLVLVSVVVDFIWFIMPFGFVSAVIHGDKLDK